MDDLRTALAELAPEVDTDAALETFRTHVRRSRRRRRIGTALAMLAVVGLVALVASAAGHDGRTQVVAGSGDRTASERSTLLPGRDFTELAVIAGGRARPGTLSSAAATSQIDDLRNTTGLATPIHLEQGTVILSMTVVDDDCPDTIAAFERTDHVLTPSFDSTHTGCDDPAGALTFVVALTPPADLRPAFTLRLPAHPPYHEESRLRVEVPSAGSPSTATTTTTPTTVRTPDQDVTAIRAAFLGWIDATPKDDVAAYVEDYASIQTSLQAGIAQHSTEDLSTYSGRVDTISLLDATHAAVTYSIVHNGVPQFSERPGRAVKVTGVWKVTRGTVCDLLALGGITCPP
ncbi:MAG: hypothetical protein JO291_14450 [Acidimicrobiia bacterium]|nr:hypothetical protein [Acidimicrobiia bacterium]